MTVVPTDSAVSGSAAPVRGPSPIPSRGRLTERDPATFRQTSERLAKDRKITVPRPEANASFPFGFRLRVLDADVPRPIMMHPHWEQALTGFVREKTRGVPLNAGNRNHKDRNPKCEVAAALTPLGVLAGERTIEELQAVAAGLELPWLRSYLSFRHETATHSVLRMSPRETTAALREPFDAAD